MRCNVKLREQVRNFAQRRPYIYAYGTTLAYAGFSKGVQKIREY